MEVTSDQEQAAGEQRDVLIWICSGSQDEDDVENEESLVHDPSSEGERGNDHDGESDQSDHALKVSHLYGMIGGEGRRTVVNTLFPGPCFPSPLTQYEMVWIQAKRKQTRPAARCR